MNPVYDNFLNTPYNSKNTIVIASLKNYTATFDKAFIVYCEPVTIEYSNILALFENSTSANSTFKQKLSFKDKRIFGKKINLMSVFNNLKAYLGAPNSLTDAMDAISTQQFFYPFYESISYQTTKWNIMSLSQFLTHINIHYEKPSSFSTLLDLTATDDEGDLNLVVYYDLYCPYYDYPIRFVFQNYLSIPKK